MLWSLHIENIAVIEKADITFDAGFNVLTGETGAGKSIIIDSINAVLGERVSRDLVRSGSEQAAVSAVFSDLSAAAQDKLRELGFETDEDGMLLIQRTISAEGKGGCRINGRPATVSMLRECGRLLVNIHGQHENQALLAPEKHVEYLDRLGGLMPLRAEYRAAYEEWQRLRRQLDAVQMDEDQKLRQLDLLRYQVDEIEAAELVPGESAQLQERRTFFRNVEKIAQGLYAARALLQGDEDTDGALTGIERAVSQVQDAGRYMDEAAKLGERMENLQYELEACAEEVRGLTEQLEFDPQELEQVESRLDVIRRLTAKYGPEEEDVLAFLEKARQELEQIETADETAARLRIQLEKAEKAAGEAARRLTAARQKAAEIFTRDVLEQLKFLDMPGVRLQVQILPVPLTAAGGDHVEFRIAANPGEEPKSIARIASGGELSRIMLALKSVMADADDIDTLVYDEIDVGISGRAAWKVGIKLRETAQGTKAVRRQVLCVTHLAQIAAQAHHHLLIEKSVHDGRTYTAVRSLDRAGREDELARIIGGEVTAASREAAREMLDRVES